jgi:hypothetical protein
MATNLVVGIAAEYKGKPAFDKANKDVLGLGKGVKQLAKAYIGLAGAQKAFRFGKASVKAFVADDKAARQLSKTVTNLGLAYEATNVENFVQGLEKTFHVADDLLRPAFAKLVQVTQSYTKSKELLTTALNASAGAGVDLTTTVSDLSQAYVGNLRGLRKYNLGLTQAELSTMSFEQIQAKLNATFKGQASLAAETYAGKIDALNIAAGNAKETIGQGLVDALQNITGKDQGINDATTAIDNLASSTKLAIVEISKLIGKLSQPALGALLQAKGRAASGKSNPLFDFLYGKAPGVGVGGAYNPMSGNTPGLTAQGMKDIQARAKADKDAAKRQKELAALMVKQTKAVKEQTALAKAKAVLDKASALFNMDLIQNTAALMGKVTEDETLRLKLQQAILLGNSDAAGKLAIQLLDAQEAAMRLSRVDPLSGWSDSFAAALKALQQLRTELGSLGIKPTPFFWQGNTTDPTEAGYTDPLGIGVPPVDYGYSMDNPSFQYGQGNPNSNVNVNVTMNPDAAKLFITDVVVGNTANGNSNQLTRVTTPWMT